MCQGYLEASSYKKKVLVSGRVGAWARGRVTLSCLRPRTDFIYATSMQAAVEVFDDRLDMMASTTSSVDCFQLQKVVQAFSAPAQSYC